MRGLQGSLAGTLIAVLAATGTAAACGDGKVLFSDDFATFQTTWGKSSNELFVEGGHLVMKPKADYTLWAPNTAGIYEDMDLCSQVTTVDPVDAGNSFVGLVFWYVDDSNYYSLEIDGDGYASIWRRQNGRWLAQLDWTKSDLLKPGNGAVNELRVVTKGNVASYYLNGKLFKEGMGVPPDDGQQVGIIASSPKQGVATYSFADFKVSEPE